MTDEEHPELKPNNLASSIDKVVGIRIRECRVMRGLTQKQFANLIGVTYQQVHNYECGIHRVSASLLYEIARELDTPIDYFFEGHIKDTALPTRQRMLLDFLRHYGEIHDEKHKEALSHLTRVLALRDRVP
jgi:transcriptional regulator with XRE-family HTH domain